MNIRKQRQPKKTLRKRPKKGLQRKKDTRSVAEVLQNNPQLAFAPPYQSQEVIEKVRQKARKYKIKMLHPLQPKKKLLVLDLDHTLINDYSKNPPSLRPLVHQFLSKVCNEYNLVLWSASKMTRIERKMNELGLSNHPNYRFAFYLSIKAMANIHKRKTKPLEMIWSKFKEFNKSNTIIVDDLRQNFLLNPQSGLKIKKYQDRKTTSSTDQELKFIGDYLGKIASVKDFSKLDHSVWRYII